MGGIRALVARARNAAQVSSADSILGTPIHARRPDDSTEDGTPRRIFLLRGVV